MSEALVEGPLDKIRTLDAQAERMDEMIATDLQYYPKAVQAELLHALIGLDARSPIIGQQVIVYGDHLVTLVDENTREVSPLTIPEMGHPTYSEGRYLGYNLAEAYDREKDDTVYRVVHELDTGSVQYRDEALNLHSINYKTYICVFGAAVVPVLPQNAHSLHDLRNDAVLEEIDYLVYGIENPDKIETIRKLGELTNKILPNTAKNDDMNHQRISYLNSLGLLEGLDLHVRDVVLASKQGYVTAPEIDFTAMQESLAIKPVMFETAQGYVREPGNVISFLDGEELFIEGVLADSMRVLVPVKSL